MDLTTRRKQQDGWQSWRWEIEADHSFWRGGEAELKLQKLDGNIREEEGADQEGWVEEKWGECGQRPLQTFMDTSQRDLIFFSNFKDTTLKL